MGNSSLSSARNIRRSQNRVRFNSDTTYGPITRTLLLVLLIGTLGLMYLTQVTKTGAYGYQINELEQKRDNLIEQNESLRVEAARLQSIERVRNSEFAKTLTDEGEVSFVDSNSSNQ